MGDVQSHRKPLPYLRDILSVSIVITLPTTLPEIFGWLQTISPLASFYLVMIYGKDRGMTALSKALLIAAGLALLSGTMQAFFYTIILLPLGFSFALSLQAQRKAEMSALYGLVTLVVCYCGLWFIMTTTTGTNSYHNLQSELGIMVDQWADDALNTARATGKDDPVLQQLEVGLNQAKLYFPLILPGLLFGSLIFQVWLNLNLCSFINKKWFPDSAQWRDFRHWKLPDQLVWLLIVSIFTFIFLQGVTKVLAANSLIILGLLFCLQGFAVLTFMLEKWKVPIAMRGLIYIFLIVPGYGLFMISGLGLSDIWVNFRIPRQEKENDL